MFTKIKILLSKKIPWVLFFLVFLFGLFFYYQQKISSKTIKIGFVTDWEYSLEKVTSQKKGLSAKSFLAKAVSYYNYLLQPDLVVGGGDYLGQKPENLQDLQEINKIFRKIKAKKLYCLGKKDYRKKNLENIKKTLGIQNSYYDYKIEGIRVLILDTTQNNEPENALGTIDEKQLKWLKEQFKKPEPALLFSHHGLIKTPNKDVWRENLTNQEELLKLIKENKKKIIAVFSGNVKKDYITKKSGVPLVHIGGLTGGGTLGRFSEIKITINPKESSKMNIFLKNYGKNGSVYQIKRNLKTSSSTRISLKQRDQDLDQQKWFDVEDYQNPQGVLSSQKTGEPNLGITANGSLITAFESNAQKGKIQVKIYKNGKWSNLTDKEHPQGLISLGKGGNPNIITRNEDVFVVFTEKDYDNRIRLLQWKSSENFWKELSPQGFISKKSSHEPTVVFDKNQENLFVIFAEKNPYNPKQTQANFKKWDGKKWETLSNPAFFRDKPNSSVDEFDLANSQRDDSIYIAYEEMDLQGNHIIQVKKWNNQRLIDLINLEKPLSKNAYSPSIAVDDKENLYLSFIENHQEKIKVYRFNSKHWIDLTPHNQTLQAVEPFIETNEKGILYLAYSENKKNVVLAEENGKKTGEELIKASPWRVRVKKLTDKNWSDCEDDLNYNGYISKGSGKGDPALKTFKENLYIIFSDEESDYASRVKRYDP